MRLVYVTVSIMGVALLCAPAAAADNQSYLAAVNSLQPKANAATLLSAGKSACGIMAPGPGHEFGRMANVAVDIVWRNNALLERSDAVQLVNAAIDNLCPPPPFGGYAS